MNAHTIFRPRATPPKCAVCRKTVERMEAKHTEHGSSYTVFCHGASETTVLTALDLQGAVSITGDVAFREAAQRVDVTA
jgi:hypothetical protein